MFENENTLKSQKGLLCGHIIGTMVITEGELERNKSVLEPLGPWRHWRQF